MVLCSVKKLALSTKPYLEAADGTTAIDQRQWQYWDASSSELVDMTIGNIKNSNM